MQNAHHYFGSVADCDGMYPVSLQTEAEKTGKGYGCHSRQAGRS
jgi:hypothetical protein